MYISILPADITVNNMGGVELRDTYGRYCIYSSKKLRVEHYFSILNDDKLCVFYGSLFVSGVLNPAEYLRKQLETGEDIIFDIDGSFIYAEISSGGNIRIFSEREGLFPMYYRETPQGLMCSSDCRSLFWDFVEDKVSWSAIYDYLRYGLLIGNHTFHSRVFLLQGGSVLNYRNRKLDVKKRHFFFHDSQHEEKNDEVLFDELNEAYLKAIRKRVDRPISEMTILLSGGMDSRLVLAAFNEAFKDGASKISCASFGQPGSEEVDSARKVAELQGNPFCSIVLSPQDHIKNLKEYLFLSCGGDVFPQSYIIDVAQYLKLRGSTAFFTGSFIECHVGGTFLPDSAIRTKEKLSTFLSSNMELIKCELFKVDELKEMMICGVFERYFSGNTDNLIEEARKYDDFFVKDVIQSFIIDNRDKRLVLLREEVPGLYLDYINPNFDIDFLKAASRIPAERRSKRKFYRDFFVHAYPEYADIVYNNTTLPISAPANMWDEAKANELSRERMFAEMQASRSAQGSCVWYPRFYSDFDGYSRYDSEWRMLFEEALFSKNTFLIGRIFDCNKVRKMYEEHLSGKKNYRKKLIFLASLELFFKLQWEGK